MKGALRSQYLSIRNNIDRARKKEAGESASIKLIEMCKGYKNILSYYPLFNEVDISSFNQLLCEQGRLSLPKIEGKSIVPYGVSNMENQLKTFSHQFLEPIASCIKMEDIDCVIVPGVVFDRDGGRIGFGKGYYDRFLEENKIKIVGVAFSEQIYNGILPLKAHDIKMEELCIV